MLLFAQGYREDSGLLLESDTDEQLLIHIPFNQAVRLSGILIKGSSDSHAKAPKTVKLFVNQPTIGFADAASLTAVEEFELSSPQLDGEVVMLRPVKFSRVNCLTLFIADNQGGEEETAIEKLALLGTPGDVMDVTQIKDVSKEQE